MRPIGAVGNGQAGRLEPHDGEPHLEAFGLQPHRAETFKLSPDPLLVEKVRDIVGLYMNPPDNALVLCVDEKSQIQALERTQPLLPMRPGQIERRTHDYKRHGTTSLFAALHTVSGKVIGQMHRRHRSIELRKFLDTIDEQVPEQLDVHLIMDNLSTHKSPSIKNWLAKRPRYHVHFTPTYGSWLNLVERWFALLEQRQLKRGSHRSRVGAGAGHQGLHRRHTTRRRSPSLDEDRRRDPRQHRPLRSAHAGDHGASLSLRTSVTGH